MRDLLLYQNSFQFLSKLESGIIVTPNSRIADAVRSRITNFNVDVITMSNFLGEYTTKEELLLILAHVWQRVFKGSFNVFMQTFKLFTKLRSYTMDENVLDECLQYFHPELQEGFKAFQKFVIEANICDEQAAYYKLKVSKNSYYFYGFTYLTGVQLDMLKELGNDSECLIALSEDLFKQSAYYDWPKCVRLSDDNESFEKKEITIYKYQKGTLNNVLKKYPDRNIIFLKDDLSLEDVCELNLHNHGMQLSANFFDKEANDFFSYVKFDRKFLEDELNKERAKEHKDYLRIKVIYLTLQTMTRWQDLTGCDYIDDYSSSLIKHIVSLNLPRNYLITLGGKFKVLDLKNLENYGNKNIIIVTSDSNLNQIEDNLPAAINKVLINVGPIIRSEFGVLSIATKLQEIIQNSDTIILQEEGAEKKYAIGNLWKCFEIKYQNDYLDHISDKHYYLPTPISGNRREKYSPSALQSYMDCPYKYYLTYELKVKSDYVFSKYITSFELGDLTHALIAALTSQKDKAVNLHIQQFFDDFLINKNKSLSKIYYQETLTKLKNRVLNGLEFLSRFQDANFIFEEKVDNGRIDCIIEWKDRVGIFDFKSSVNVYYEDLKRFDPIQLWYYAKRWPRRLSWIGLIDVHDLSKSKILSEVELGVIKVNLNEDLNRYIGDYAIFEDDLIKKMKTDNFTPRPNEKKSNVCDYCVIRNICEASLCRK